MNYLELNFSLPPNFPSEILVAHLAELGFDSFTEEEGCLKAYIEEKNFNEEEVTRVVADIAKVVGRVVSAQPRLAMTSTVVPAQNWNEAWEKNFQPVFIGENCVIRASFHAPTSNIQHPTSNIQYDILIEPKMAFGTGHHETTYLMAEKLMEMEVGGKEVLDMGCGTGILAILASKMGASEILAIDNNEDAVRNAQENVALNELKNVNVQKGDAGVLVDRRFSHILANINRNILLRDMERYTGVLENEGILMLSGFFESDESALTDKAKSLGLNFVEKAVKNRWCVLKFKK